MLANGGLVRNLCTTMKPINKRTVRAVIFNPDGKLLLIERRKLGEHYFVLPGGHVVDHEIPKEAILREVKEETGLTVTVVKLLYNGIDSFGNEQKIYLCHYYGGEPQLPYDSQEGQVDHATGQLHRPHWFLPETLDGTLIYPPTLLETLEVDILNNFANNPKELNG